MADAPVVDPVLVSALRSDLSAAGYTVDGVDDLLGDVAAAALRRQQPAAARRVLTRSRGPAGALARTFLLGDAVAREDLDAALPATGTAGAAALGLVTVSGGQVRAGVDLRPYAADDEHWWVTSDLGQQATRGPLRADHVLGVGGASTTLAQLTLRRPVERVLDLGTGCGVQALHALGHASSVTATDVSGRALRFAGFNAALAGAELDLRRGSLLAPVAGESFDLVVSNPPFVITPRVPGVPTYEYRDGGLAGDELVRRLVVEVGEVLRPGGVAQLLGNWEHVADGDWRDRVGGWLTDSGLDGWVVQREVLDPAEYAETWVRDGGLPPGPDFDDLVAAWLEDFDARGVTAVGFGYVVLRRPATGPPRLGRLEEHAGAVHQPLGAHLARCLDHHDLLRSLDDGTLLAGRWVVAPDVTEERHHVPGLGEPSVVLLRQNTGFGRTVRVGTVLAATVGACDGELPLSAIAAALADLLGLGEAEVRAEVASGVRALAEDAFLAPA